MISIKEFETGATISTPLLNGGVSVKLTKVGKEYLQITGKDKTGSIDLKVWDPNLSELELLKEAKVLFIEGLVDEFNGTKQINVKNIRPAEETEYKLEDLLLVEPGYSPDIVKYLRSLIETIEDNDIYMIADKLFSSHEKLYDVEPAAIGHHHSAIGGMAVHIMEVVNEALSKLTIYKHLISPTEIQEIKDYVIAGAILHDIGKFYEYEKDDNGYYISIAKEGSLTGHLAYGFYMVMDTGRALGADSEKTMNLAHICLSHHEKPEWGSTVAPAHRAAVFVSKADQNSASINPFLNDYNKQETVVGESRNLFGNRTIKNL